MKDSRTDDVIIMAIGRMWQFFQLVPLGHVTEPSFGPIRLTAWPPGGRTWKSEQSDISPELSVGLLPYFYLKYRRLTQYIFHPSFWFYPRGHYHPIIVIAKQLTDFEFRWKHPIVPKIHEGLPNGWRHHHGGLIFCICRWVENLF
jgi:hypothetical protein